MPDTQERFSKPYRFKCIQCGKCCSEPNTIVNLTFHDIIRIKNEMNLDLRGLLDIVGFYVFPGEPTEEQLKQMIVPPIKTQRGLAFIGLKKEENGKCVYLDSDNHCEIYNTRPNICRTFPFHFHSVPVKKPKPQLKMYMDYATKAMQYCPGIGKPSPVVKPKSWLELGDETVKDILAEIILVRKWNKAVDSDKIQPIAENFLQVVLELENEDKSLKPKTITTNIMVKEETGKKKISKQDKEKYQVRLRNKLKKE
jgi:uncharacterized protein